MARGEPLRRLPAPASRCFYAAAAAGARAALPVAVQRALDPHDPDEPADEREQDPEAGPARQRRVSPSPWYMCPTSDGITKALTIEITIAITRPSTPPRPCPVRCFISSKVL